LGIAIANLDASRWLPTRLFRRRAREADARQPAENAEGAPSRDATATRARPRRPAWRSPLTRRILALNVLVLVVPVLGLMHLEQYRESLIRAETESMRIQARAFAATLANSAVVVTEDGQERLLRQGTQHTMRVLLSDSNVRARVFRPEGKLLVDSFVLMGPGGKVRVEKLPPQTDNRVGAWLSTAYGWVTDLLPGVDERPLYRENKVQRAGDYREVTTALQGEPGSAVRRDGDGGLVLSVAVPVQRYRQVLGALMVSQDGSTIAQSVRDRRLDILIVFAAALGVTVLLSIYLASTIARPVRRLADAADRVRHAKGRQVTIPDLSHRRDEIGELSASLTEMTEALWDRLDAIERFAADVAHEIKNPLTSVRSAVETAARVEDPEQQKRLMSIIQDDVQRLDRLISDISDASRLDAELSRADTAPVEIARLLEALVEVQRASYAETSGPWFALDLHGDPNGEGDPLTVPGIEGRLAQVFRNLLANAATFSPDGATVHVAAWREPEAIVMTIADEGPGIPPNKLNAIFDRFYSERPRDEKFGGHSGLGLSISRQIVNAHGGTIHAENREDAEGNVAGARFVVRLPVV
jgi:two-component system sensor histidine kinase ChvG